MDRKDFFKTIGSLGVVSSLYSNKFSASSGEVVIEYKKVKLELFHQWTITRGSASYKENVFIKYKKDGITGYGEAGHMTAAGQNADKTIKVKRPTLSVFLICRRKQESV